MKNKKILAVIVFALYLPSVAFAKGFTSAEAEVIKVFKNIHTGKDLKKLLTHYYGEKNVKGLKINFEHLQEVPKVEKSSSGFTIHEQTILHFKTEDIKKGVFSVSGKRFTLGFKDLAQDFEAVEKAIASLKGKSLWNYILPEAEACLCVEAAVAAVIAIPLVLTYMGQTGAQEIAYQKCSAITEEMLENISKSPTHPFTREKLDKIKADFQHVKYVSKEKWSLLVSQDKIDKVNTCIIEREAWAKKHKVTLIDKPQATGSKSASGTENP
jgi:hypothetical protein